MIKKHKSVDESLIVQVEIAQKKLKAAEMAYISLLRDYQELKKELVKQQFELKEMFYTFKQYERWFEAGNWEWDEEF